MEQKQPQERIGKAIARLQQLQNDPAYVQSLARAFSRGRPDSPLSEIEAAMESTEKAPTVINENGGWREAHRSLIRRVRQQIEDIRCEW